MKLSKLIPAAALVGGAVAAVVYKLQKDKKEIMKLDEGLLLDQEGDSFDDFHIDSVKAPTVDDKVNIPAFQEEEAQKAETIVLDEKAKAKIVENVEEALATLADVQDVHTAERPVEHRLTFTNEEDQESFKAEVVKRGYIVTKGEQPYHLVCTHIAPMERELMIRHVTFLYEAALKHHGTYEGWHCDPVY